MNDLLEIMNLHIVFDTPRGDLHVVNDISLSIGAGEIFGLVGESGCGKSITGLSILGLMPKTGRILNGQIHFRGENLLAKSQQSMRKIRGAEIAMIFQDPFTSMNPVFKIGRQLNDVMRQHQHINAKGARNHIKDVLQSVGLPDINRIYDSYPHELSGGQQQRVMIAMALISEPSLIIADEPTTALDVTIQAQILRLLRDLCDEHGISILLITHDLGVVAEVCDRVAVLYAGSIVETAPTGAVLENPQHPYTQGLLNAIPIKGRHLQAIAGTVPANPGAIKGCVFASRCAHVHDRCQEEKPVMEAVGEAHQSACFLNGALIRE
jgi:oligopeptide/dipeptide ABC transporter ATP-binding protein